MRVLSLTLLAMVFFALLPVAHAGLIDVSADTTTAAVRSGTYLTFDMAVKNNQNTADKIVISVSGSRPWWRVPTALMVPFNAREEKTISQSFYPVNAREGDYHFLLHFSSLSSPWLEATLPLTITIIPPVIPTTLEAVYSDGEITAALGVDADNEQMVDATFEITDSQGRVIKTFTTTETVAGSETIGKVIPFQLSSPGEYELYATVNGVEVSTSFTIADVREFRTRKEIVSNWMGDTVITTVTNTGNIPRTYHEKRSVPAGSRVTGFAVAPAGVADGPRMRTYSYELFLKPGETGSITYTVERWPLAAQLGGILITVAILGGVVSRMYTKPRIRKRHRRKKGGMISIALHVKNAFSDSKNVLVRDWVSPLATVVAEEFESVRPVVRQSSSGTELIWSLGHMKPREERIVSYKIRPLVRASLKMSRAHMRYKNRSGDAMRIHSNTVSLK